MNIEINPDIEEKYKNEFVKGFTIRETVSLAAAAAIVAGTAAILYFKLGVPFSAGIYAGLPIALPVIIAGFKKYQGLTAIQYLREIWWEKRTKKLAFEAEEAVEDTRPWTLEKNGQGGKR